MWPAEPQLDKTFLQVFFVFYSHQLPCLLQYFWRLLVFPLCIFLFCNLNLCAIKVNLKSISWQCIRWTAGNILKKMKPKHLDRTLVADGSVGHKQTSPTRPTKNLNFMPKSSKIWSFPQCSKALLSLRNMILGACGLLVLSASFEKKNPTHFCSHLTQQQRAIVCPEYLVANVVQHKPQWKFRRDPFNHWLPSRSLPSSPMFKAVAVKTLHFSKCTHIRWLNTTNMQ